MIQLLPQEHYNCPDEGQLVNAITPVQRHQKINYRQMTNYKLKVALVLGLGNVCLLHFRYDYINNALHELMPDRSPSNKGMCLR